VRGDDLCEFDLVCDWFGGVGSNFGIGCSLNMMARLNELSACKFLPSSRCNCPSFTHWLINLFFVLVNNSLYALLIPLGEMGSTTLFACCSCCAILPSITNNCCCFSSMLSRCFCSATELAAGRGVEIRLVSLPTKLERSFRCCSTGSACLASYSSLLCSNKAAGLVST